MSAEIDDSVPRSLGENWREVIATDQPVGYSLIHFAEIVDAEGIPINGDRSSLPRVADGSIDWEYDDCPYVTSPSRLPENQIADPPKPMSFLERRRLVKNYLPMLGIMKHLRVAMFGEAKAEADDSPLDFIDASRVLSATKFAVHYLLFRAEGPIDPDAVHPSLLVAYNSVMGALAGMSNGISSHNPQGTPVSEGVPSPAIDEIMQTTERKGAFVGARTVCAAPPNMARHLLAAVLTGAKLNRAQVPEWFAAELPDREVTKLVKFADSMQLFESAALMVEKYDVDATKSIRAELARQSRKKTSKRNPRRIRSMVSEFRDASTPYMGRMISSHREINPALGRKQGNEPDALIGPSGVTHMPALIDELLAENPDYLPPKLLTAVSRDRT